MSQALRDIPAVRALAEREARTYAAAWADAKNLDYLAWDRLDAPTQEKHIATHLALLTDLSRPASRDAVARLVAEAVGLECGATAPDFRFEVAVSGSGEWIRPAGWSLFSGPNDNWYFWYGEPEEWDDGGRRKDWIWLPGTAVSDADPAAALTAIALHILTPDPA